MLRGQYEEACRMVMTGREDERPEVAAARRLFLDKGDIKVRGGKRRPTCAGVRSNTWPP